jgi:hypothetical protein
LPLIVDAIGKTFCTAERAKIGEKVPLSNGGTIMRSGPGSTCADKVVGICSLGGRRRTVVTYIAACFGSSTRRVRKPRGWDVEDAQFEL